MDWDDLDWDDTEYWLDEEDGYNYYDEYVSIEDDIDAEILANKEAKKGKLEVKKAIDYLPYNPIRDRMEKYHNCNHPNLAMVELSEHLDHLGVIYTDVREYCPDCGAEVDRRYANKDIVWEEWRIGGNRIINHF